MKAAITRWCREPIDDDLATDAVNDSVEKLWLAIATANMSALVGGPVQNLSFSAGDERKTVVSIADPTVAPTLSQAASGNLPAHTLFAAYTLVTESGSETLPSPTASLAILVNQLGLIAPPAFVPGAIGWNLYAATADGTRLALQNAGPIDFGASWQEPPSGVVSAPDLAAPPTMNGTADDIVYINVLEVQNPDNTWTRWNGADLQGLMMTRAERSIAPNSTYFPYFYDLVNGSTFEVRPALGGNAIPRYFYTKKPRRLRFDQAPIPLQRYSGSTECVRDYAIAKVKMSLEEFEAAQGWMANATATRAEILSTVNLMNRNKVRRITPFMS